jgi:hypothetical protein
MDALDTIGRDLAVIREMLAQDMTISHYSILRDETVRQAYIQAVNDSAAVGVIREKTVPLLIEANAQIRSEGFLSIVKMRGKTDNAVFDSMAQLLGRPTDLARLTSMMKPAFYFFKQEALIENVLIHDGLLMSVLGYGPEELEFTLCNMLGIPGVFKGR